MRYAAYGSNLHPLRLTERISSVQLLTTGYLPGFSLAFHKRSKDESGKCSIQAGEHGVHFAIFEIAAEDKLTLDRIEGVGSGYSDITLVFPGIGKCASYIAQDTHVDDLLRPYDWYKELVLSGARYHGFPDGYLKRIRSVKAIRDPEAIRRKKMWRKIESMETVE